MNKIIIEIDPHGGFQVQSTEKTRYTVIDLRKSIAPSGDEKECIHIDLEDYKRAINRGKLREQSPPNK